jgi:hypothetical protein
MRNLKISFLLYILITYITFSRDDLKYVDTKHTTTSDCFIANKGQWNPEVKFLAKMNGMNAWITTTGIVYDYYKIEDNTPEDLIDYRKIDRRIFEDELRKRYNLKIDTFQIRKGHVVKLEYVGISNNVKTDNIDKLETYYNYFIGNDSTKWASYVPLYKEVIIKDAYNGIDIRYYFDSKSFSNQSGTYLRYDFIVNPGADVSEIKMKFSGQDGININGKGELILKTSIGDVTQGDVLAFQNLSNTKIKVKCNFQLDANGTIHFVLDDYEESKQLVIDPIVFSTFIGGSDDEQCLGLCVGNNGISYIYGLSTSTDFPITTGAYNSNLGANLTATVTKLNSTGTALIFSTFVDQVSHNGFELITLDDSDNIIIAGSTISTSFPIVSGAFQTTHYGGLDGFVTKLNSSGSYLINSTYFGGSSDDSPSSIKIHSDGSVYLCGQTNSTNFPVTSGAIQTAKNLSDDAFILRFNSNFSSLIFSTYLSGNDGGTNDYDDANQIDIDASGNVFVTGGTANKSFPVTSGAYQTSFTNVDAIFITKINSSGTSILYSTFFTPNCASSYMKAIAIKVDRNGDVISAGYINGSCLPVTAGVYQSSSRGDFDCIIYKFNSTLSSLIFATYLGGSGYEYFRDLVIDPSNNIILTGTTASNDFPLTGGCRLKGDKDCFVSKLNSSGSSLIYSFLLGGMNNDGGFFIKTEESGSLYILGETFSSNFPTISGSYDINLSGVRDLFVTKITPPIDWPQLKTISSNKFDSLLCLVNHLDTFYVHNTSFCDFDITSKSITGANAGDFRVVEPANFPVNVLPGDSVRFQVIFSTLTAGNKSATLTLNHTGYPNPYSISLSGVKDIVKVVFEATTADTIKMNMVTCPVGSIDTNFIIKNVSSVPTTVVFTDVTAPFEVSGLNADKSLYLSLNGLAEVKVRFTGLPAVGKVSRLFSFSDTCGKIKYILLNATVKQPIAKAGKDTAICFDSYANIGDSATSGTIPYSYEWAPTQFLYEANIAKPRTMPLKSNTEFYLKVTDALGCTGYDTVLVIVAPVMTLLAVPNQTVCKGNSTILKPNVSGGLLPYKYKWSPAKSLNMPDTSNPIATPDISTMYYYTITDSAGCMVHDSIMVYVKPNVKVNAGTDTTICPGYTITLTGKAEEGSTPYKSFKWTPNTGLDDPNILSPKLRILKSGTYNYVLSVTDALDCIGRDTVMITITDPPEIQITGDTLICYGTTTTLSIEPQINENTFLWSTGETTETISVSKEGRYSVEVTDKTGCTGLDTLEVKTYPKIFAKFKLDRSPELCAGSKLNISTEDKYSYYMWSTGNTEDNITVNLPGSYFVEVTDINGCKAISDTVKVTLVDSLKPLVIISNNGIICPNGSLNLTTEYNYTTYLWNTGETTKSITITQSGKYSVHVKDDGGCEGTSEIIDIIQGAEPKPIISGSTILCKGESTTITVTNDYKKYKWNTGDTTKSISITNPGTYSVTVTDTNGCEGSASTTITEFKPDVIQMTDIDFGVRKVNSTSKKNIELKNTNTQQVTIYSIKIKGLEANTFTAMPTPVPPKNLNQNESINIEIDYLPTASKSYLDSLIIDITEPCVQTIVIAVKGSASDSVKTQISTSVWIPDLSAKIGQLNFCIPLMAKKDDNEPYDDNVSYKAVITLDASVMNPTTNKGTIASGKRTIEITGDNIQLTENPTKIGEICGQIFIGDREITPIEIINFEWSDKDIINKTTNGSIKVSGICQPNIARIKLINPVEFTIKQTIVSNELVISTKNTTNEDILTIYSIIGIEMESYVCSGQMDIDISGLASGVYFVRIGDRVGKFVKM